MTVMPGIRVIVRSGRRTRTVRMALKLLTPGIMDTQLMTTTIQSSQFHPILAAKRPVSCGYTGGNGGGDTPQVCILRHDEAISDNAHSCFQSEGHSETQFHRLGQIPEIKTRLQRAVCGATTLPLAMSGTGVAVVLGLVIFVPRRRHDAHDRRSLDGSLKGQNSTIDHYEYQNQVVEPRLVDEPRAASANSVAALDRASRFCHGTHEYSRVHGYVLSISRFGT
jgi:hypothetical protein